MNNDENGLLSASAEAVEYGQEMGKTKEERSAKMNENQEKKMPDETDRKYDRRTRLLFEYIDTVYMLSHALDNRLAARKKMMAGEDAQCMVEANLRLSSVIARRMFGLMKFKHEIDDEIEELAEMAKGYGFELI